MIRSINTLTKLCSLFLVFNCLSVVLVYLPAEAQTTSFSETTSLIPDLPFLRYSSVAWGDYDNDDRLDFLLSGYTNSIPVCRIYHQKNDGSGFEDATPAGLPQADYSSLTWVDYDNDGYLEPSFTYNGICKIYHQKSDGSGFEDKTPINLPAGIDFIAWGDYDNDGRQDFIVTAQAGTTISNPLSKLFHQKNDGSGFEDNTPIDFPQVSYGNVAWADYDNDGRLDFLITGLSASGPISRINHQKSDGSGFENKTPSGLPQVFRSGIAWSDYDNDGKLDFLIQGIGNSGSYYGSLYHQKSDGSGFEGVFSIPELIDGSVVWGDYDNDGKLDFLTNGNSFSSGAVTALYHKVDYGSGFISIGSAGFPAVIGKAAWGDYDNDGKLDMFTGGRLFHNETTLSNTLPKAPTGLTSSVDPNTRSITFSWDKATDSQTPQNGLHYNLYVSDNPTDQNLLPAQADPTSGFRRVVKLGNSHATSFTLTGLTQNKTYYWSVQAVDAAFAGSPFAAQQQVSVIALPVQLYNFQGQAVVEGAELNWQTAWELNNRGFEIQKSLDAVNYHVIGWVDGIRNSSQTQSYRFVDASLGQTSYYRLRQVDWDNKSATSRAVTVSPSKNSQVQLIGFANPITGDRLQAQVMGVDGASVRVEWVDLQGRLVKYQEWPSSHKSTIPIDWNINDNRGFYLLRAIITPVTGPVQVKTTTYIKY